MSLKIGLVAMPWNHAERPSSAISAIAPFLRRELPEVQVHLEHEYFHVARHIGYDLYKLVSHNAYEVGELLYAAMMYPENRERVIDYCADFFEKNSNTTPDKLLPREVFMDRLPSWRIVMEVTLNLLEDRQNRFIESLVGKYDVIGLTTSFGQMFGNLHTSKRIKELNPDTKIILGGSTVSGRVGPSLLCHYDFLDFVIQGEGELPMTEFIRKLQDSSLSLTDPGIKGLLTRKNAAANAQGVPMWEVTDMNDLPDPDFDSYASELAKVGIPYWVISVEGSRGCWWDRTKASNNPKKTCHFCNLNVQWNGYREKSSKRVVDEAKRISERFGSTDIMFLDNVIRLNGVAEFAEQIIESNVDFNYFYEMRANVTHYELLKLRESGLRRMQIGIEGLSTSYLRRIGKGTTLLQNLSVMKVASELDISNESNLLLDFPGSTQDEVNETLTTINDYAWHLEPLRHCSFWLAMGSTVNALEKQYPIKNVRNRDFYRQGLPDDLYESLQLFDLSYDSISEPADWKPVLNAIFWWWGLYLENNKKKLVCYTDGGSFLNVMYGSAKARRQVKVMRQEERELYLYCSTIRQDTEILQYFERKMSQPLIEEMMASWMEAKLAYREGSRVLALAPSSSPEFAKKRILQQHFEEMEMKKQRSRPPRTTPTHAETAH